MDDLRPTALTSIPGGMALVAARFVKSEWAAETLTVIGFILVFIAVVILFFWCRDTWVDQSIRIWNAQDRQYMLAQEAARLNSEQIKFVMQASHMGVDVGMEGERYLHGTDAPMGFVETFLSMSSFYSLLRIRYYSEGTKERTWAQEITNLLVAAGYAKPAVGNQAATWAAGITPAIIAGKLGLQPPPLRESTPEGWQELP